MQYTTEKIEQTRSNIAQTEERIVRQRRRVEKMLVERNPAEEAQARLLIMEQSLIAMTRFLKNLERDLNMGDLSLHRHQTAKRIKAAKSKTDGDAALAGSVADAPKSPEVTENNS